ncbi:anhydro-N-acetylmuramic acid kinase [Piscinibacter sakaiensis]|uniref:anhydro-N-acetylmuramic acid kinase n=1 Tax=Piscinibacter sakaiensis TaxID=1547922 RepID=UPI003AAC81C6
MAELFIGLMSGTSLDGMDGVLVDLGDCDAGRLQVLAHAHLPYADVLGEELLALNASGSNEMHRTALAGNAVARVCAEVARALLETSATTASAVRAIGAHGQTVRHRPGEFDGIGYTVQINNAALLAELTGIDTVADFRSRDVAAGGQGAPLVPAFHRAVFGRPGRCDAVLNIGGMSNITVLRRDGSTTGFDCGPGNALLDLWCQRHLDTAYDENGQWAAGGRPDADLLARLLADPFFSASPPKSTGRDHFNAQWLDGHLAASSGAAATSAQDIQATLTELTAAVCAAEMLRHAPDAERLLVCGGGALNAELMRRLAAKLPSVEVVASDEAGLPANQVEAVAFAWLARACLLRRPGNLQEVTGAQGPRILGAVYPGR